MAVSETFVPRVLDGAPALAHGPGFGGLQFPASLARLNEVTQERVLDGRAEVFAP